MKTIFQLCFFSSNDELLRVSHRVFSDAKDAISYGERVLENDRACDSFKLSILLLDNN